MHRICADGTASSRCFALVLCVIHVHALIQMSFTPRDNLAELTDFEVAMRIAGNHIKIIDGGGKYPAQVVPDLRQRDYSCPAVLVRWTSLVFSSCSLQIKNLQHTPDLTKLFDATQEDTEAHGNQLKLARDAEQQVITFCLDANSL